jgi:hypothetical protein
MDRNSRNNEVPRLWCFAPSGIEPRIQTMNSHYRWARMSHVPRDQRPPWSHELRGECYILCESYGGYNGCLGYPGAGQMGPDPEKLKQTYRRKHPTWSEGKIARAIGRSPRSSPTSGFLCGGTLIKEKDILGFLESICAAGPVTLLLDDGGTANVNLGGTSGLPESHRVPRVSESYCVNLRLGRLEDALPPPYWVPVMVYK